MNKKFNATASATLSTSSYVAPKAEMLGVTVEGVLCASGVGGFNELDYQNNLNGW